MVKSMDWGKKKLIFFMKQSLLLFSSVNLMREMLSLQYSELKVIINSVYSCCQVTSLLVNNSWYCVINNILCRRKPCLGLLSVSLICRNMSTHIASTSVYSLSIVMQKLLSETLLLKWGVWLLIYRKLVAKGKLVSTRLLFLRVP